MRDDAIKRPPRLRLRVASRFQEDAEFEQKIAIWLYMGPLYGYMNDMSRGTPILIHEFEFLESMDAYEDDEEREYDKNRLRAYCVMLLLFGKTHEYFVTWMRSMLFPVGETSVRLLDGIYELFVGETIQNDDVTFHKTIQFLQSISTSEDGRFPFFLAAVANAVATLQDAFFNRNIYSVAAPPTERAYRTQVLPTHMIVHRGVAMPKGRTSFRDEANKFQLERGFLSTTQYVGVAKSFLGDSECCMFEMFVEDGSHYIRVNQHVPRNSWFHGEEREIPRVVEKLQIPESGPAFVLDSILRLLKGDVCVWRGGTG